MSMTSINWYPGHMKKTKELITDNLKIVDLVVEVVDARIPLSSKNPDIAKLSKNKKRVIALNKADLVDRREIKYWKDYFIENGYADDVVEISALTGYNLKNLYAIIEKIAKEKLDKAKKKGLRTVTTRMLIAGIPNVGKSKLINKLVGRKAAGVGNTPGFTKGKQWIKVKQGIELLDTPGILWPKFQSEDVGIRLAISGAIKDTILDIEYVAKEFLSLLKREKKVGVIIKRYGLDESDMEENPQEILEKIALKMGMLIKGGKANIHQVSYQVIRDYRSIKLGKFGIDKVDIVSEV